MVMPEKHKKGCGACLCQSSLRRRLARRNCRLKKY